MVDEAVGCQSWIMFALRPYQDQLTLQPVARSSSPMPVLLIETDTCFTSEDAQALLYDETDHTGSTADYKHRDQRTGAFISPASVMVIWGTDMGKSVNRHHTPQPQKYKLVVGCMWTWRSCTSVVSCCS